jgi:hypothetical protein
MKTLKKTITILFTAIVLSVVLSACNKCKDTVCLNGGACSDGTCICPDGFEGVNCQTKTSTGGGGGGGGGGGITTGSVTFWNSDVSSTITVITAGYSDVITSYTNPTSCGTSGCANFTLPAGNYSYSASAGTGETWSGSFTITSGGCLRYNLHL